MRADTLVANQLLMAQAVDALADHIANSACFALNPVTFVELPSPPAVGIIASVSDSTVNTWGSVVAGGGTNKVLCWYNGVNWTVVGA